MKLKQLLTNKKLVIVAIAVLLALIIGIIILVLPHSETGEGNHLTVPEEELEILEPDEVAPEDSTDVSGTWGDETESSTQESNTDSKEQNKTEVQNQGNSSNDENEEKNETVGNESEKEDGILKDSIDWGNIY